VDKSYHSAVGTRALDSYVKQALNQASFDLLTLKKGTTSAGKVTITSQCLQDPGKYELSKPKLLSVSADQATI
jgi:hypothetical protein